MSGLALFELTARPCPHERRGQRHRTHAKLVECVLRNGSPGFVVKRIGVVLGTRMRQRRWRVRARARLLDALGGYCGANAPDGVGCGANGRTPLEFAHLKPTGLNGQGRGHDRRLKDVRENPGSYCLLCHPCHVAFDVGM